MKARCKLKYVLIVSFGLLLRIGFAHEVPVHRAITVNAAEAAYANSSAYAGFVNMVSSDGVALEDATNKMVIGSAEEDDSPQQDPTGGGYRSYNHFYDPLDTIYGKGLSDSVGFSGPGPIGDKRRLVGTNSFAWGSVSNCLGIDFSGVLGFGKNVNTSNVWSWPQARAYEWLGLTATNQSDRQTNLLAMFRAVGQVMHLLEDASQPQHVRNEQHVFPYTNWFVRTFDPWISPIEEYGKKNVANLNYGDGSMLDWRGAGFTKLEDFWDRQLYNGDVSKLVADNNENPNGGPNTLGLAEWCNGNFLGDRHLFPEYYNPGDIEYYPYPSRNHSTDYNS
jgi:hypothetical protein